jgi:hypothetical protein
MLSMAGILTLPYKTYHVFNTSVCERPTSIVVNPHGRPEAKGASGDRLPEA